jgi:hypothetical protein
VVQIGGRGPNRSGRGTTIGGSDHASDWFSARAEMAQEVPLESYDEHDDERNMLIVEGEGDQTDPLERET